MEKLSRMRLNDLIKIYEDGIYSEPINPPCQEEMLSVFLELKQLRAERDHQDYIQ